MWPFKRKEECRCKDDCDFDSLKKTVEWNKDSLECQIYGIKKMLQCPEFMIVDPEIVWGVSNYSYEFYAPIPGRKEQIWVRKPEKKV